MPAPFDQSLSNSPSLDLFHYCITLLLFLFSHMSFPFPPLTSCPSSLSPSLPPAQLPQLPFVCSLDSSHYCITALPFLLHTSFPFPSPLVPSLSCPSLHPSLHLIHPCLRPNSPFSSLNTVREVCTRCPLAMNADLLQDLAGYKSYRDKSVVMAARSLIQLFRSVRPELLSRKDRVRKQTM